MSNIDRNKIVRIFRDKNNMRYCLSCDGIINSTTQKKCPPAFIEERHLCLCRYSDERVIIYSKELGKLFNNTTDEIISTIYNCGYDINQCHVENCDKCNLNIVIEHFKEE